MTASQNLKSAQISHALTGGFALALYGINRATADIDLLADGKRKNDIIAILENAGFKLFHETPEVLQFEGVGSLDIILANRPISQKMLEMAKEADQVGVRVLCPEDIIGLKIQAYKNDNLRRLQDQADIQAIILKNKTLDWKRIKQYADLFGEWKTLLDLGAPHDF